MSKRKFFNKAAFFRLLPLYLMMVPGLAYLLINNYIPMAGLTIAFRRVNFTLGIMRSPWVGFDNFTFLFRTRDAFVIFRNTILYNLTFIVLGTVFAIFVAVLLGMITGKLLRVYQTVILLPFIISIAVVAYLAFAFLSFETGFINRSILEPLGADRISWYASPQYWPVILTIVHLWRGFGHASIIYYATLIGIDTAYYEAAVIDGAGTWKQIRYITLPCLKPTIITLLLLHLGRMFFSDFGLFYLVPMNNGLLFNATNVLDTYVFRGLMELNDLGRASAAGFLQSTLGFVTVLGANFAVRKFHKEGALF